MGTSTYKDTDRDESALAALPYYDGDPFSVTMRLLHKALFHGQYDTIPFGTPDGKQMEQTLLYLQQLQYYLVGLASDAITSPIPLEGYTGTLLRDLQNYLNHLHTLAATDPLTGVANRRHFFQVAIRELERVRRKKAPVCLAMLDIDHFKTLNDTLGHSAGDKALQRIATIITGAVRPYDLVGRYGGDEFIFLFPEVSQEQAYALLERLRDAIDKEKIATGKGKSHITVSIGLIELKVNKEMTANYLECVIQCADDMLYTAKNHSRNHISFL